MHRFKRDLNISADKFIFLRSDDCASKDAVEIPTEVWWIPDENSLPPHLEKFKPCQIKGVFSSKDYRNDYEYEQSLVVLKRTVNSLNKKGGKFLGFVIGDYHKTPNKLLLKRLNKAKRILSKEIRNGLVTVKTRKEKNSDLVEFVKGNFPLLQISKITEICD